MLARGLTNTIVVLCGLHLAEYVNKLAENHVFRRLDHFKDACYLTSISMPAAKGNCHQIAQSSKLYG